MKDGSPGLFDDGPIVCIADPVSRFGLWREWCNHERSQIEIIVIIDPQARRMYRPCCLRCGYYPGGFHFEHSRLTTDELNRARVIQSREKEPNQACKRCGAVAYLQEHHWAPRSRFADADDWPTSLLCQECHTRWHQVMGVSDD